MTEEESDTTRVDEIMEAARSRGDRPSIPGRFTIDRAAARRKLQRYHERADAGPCTCRAPGTGR